MINMGEYALYICKSFIRNVDLATDFQNQYKYISKNVEMHE